MSVDFISEKDVLEAIYNRVFEEKQQARKEKRSAAGNPNQLILTNLTGHRKDVIQKELAEKIPAKEGDSILQTYPKDEILNAIRAHYDDKEKNFFETAELLETLRLGEPRKINFSKMSKYYLEPEIPTEDLPRVCSFDFFLTGDTLNNE